MENKEILEFLKDYKELFQDRPENLDWAEIYNLAGARFRADDLGKFTEFWLNRGIHPEEYLTELPMYFLCDSSIEEFTIPSNIKSIGNSAFSSCDSLTSITIPDSVTNIGANAFAYSKKLTNIRYNGTIAQWNAIRVGMWWRSGIGDYTVYCIDGTLSGRGW